MLAPSASFYKILKDLEELGAVTTKVVEKSLKYAFRYFYFGTVPSYESGVIQAYAGAARTLAFTRAPGFVPWAVRASAQ